MSEENNSVKKDYLQKPWATLSGVIAVLVMIAAVYCIWHSSIKGSINAKLSDKDKSAVTFILTDSLRDTTVSAKQDLDSIKIQKAIHYILGANPPADSLTAIKFKEEYSTLTVNAFIDALPSITVTTSSFFWLEGDRKYLEVIFWSIFGVLASLLYMASEAMRKNEFKPEELPVYWAKLFYAPLITLIIVFSYKTITASGEAKFDNTSIEIIIFSFVLGFFSGRAIELLNKIKDVVLPGKSGAQEEAAGKIILAGAVDLSEDLRKSNPDFDKSKLKVILTPVTDRAHPVEKETDKDGVFYFPQVKEGVYDVEATKKINDIVYSASIKNKKITKDKPVELTNLLMQKEREDK